MSRTFRRKNDQKNEYEYVDAWYTYSEHEHQAINVDYTVPRAIRLAHYHGDMLKGWNAPARFRRDCNREFRSKNKAILDHAIRIDTDPVFIPFIHNANWNYW